MTHHQHESARKVAHVHITKDTALTGHIIPKGSALGAFAFLALSALGGIWVMQNSINAYFMQTYHTPSPIASITHPAWLKGGEIGNALYANLDVVSGNIASQNERWIKSFNDNYAFTPEFQKQWQEKQALEAKKLAEQQALQQQAILANQKQAMVAKSLTINTSQKVLFAGDSMMQGIAPHMQKYLQGIGIQSINLSKQSTGLAYPKFFNWPQTIKDAIAKDGSIKVLMVMLGPNDPWDMPATKGGQVKFGTPEWDVDYQSRMADIINFASQHGVGVIWVTPPNMKKAKLNEQMIALNAIMQQELERHAVKVIDSRPIMGGQDDVYSDYLSQDGKQIKMRSGDGIHFSIEGQKILAKHVQSQLIIE